MRAALYIRVSTDRQASEGISLDAQTERAAAYCASRGLTIAATLREEGQSARKLRLEQRPAGRELLRLIASGAISHVVAFKLDRIFRDNIEALQRSKEWDAAGVHLHILDIGGDTVDTGSASGRLYFAMLSAFAQHESDQTSERVRSSMRQIASSGRSPANRPFGYARADRALVPDPITAPIVREMFMRAAAGASLVELVRWLHSEGITTRNGNARWSISSVRWVLSNPIYVGDVVWGDMIVPGAHEPLASAEDFLLTQEHIASRAPTRGRSSAHYTPLLRCGQCGGRMALTGSHGPSADRYYYCVQRKRYRPPLHPQARIGERLLVAMLFRHTELLIADADLPSAAQRAAARLSSAPPSPRGAAVPAAAVSAPPSPRGAGVPPADVSVPPLPRGAGIPPADVSVPPLPRGAGVPPADIASAATVPPLPPFPQTPKAYGEGGQGGLGSSTPSSLRSELTALALQRQQNMRMLHAGAITEDDLAALNAPLMAQEQALRASIATSASSSDLTSVAVLIAAAETLLPDLAAASIPEQVATFRRLYPLIELLPGVLRFHALPALGIEPIDRPILPRYCPKHGTPLPF